MEKIKKKLLGYLFCILFGIAGIILLWYNEERTSKTATLIKEARKSYTDISSQEINNNYDKKLVAVTGTVSTNKEPITDPIFNVQVDTPVLKRVVEMYQWKEDCSGNTEGGETCKYDKVWSEELIDSSTFSQDAFINPTEKKYESATFYNKDVKVGAFILDEHLLNKLKTEAQYIELSQEVATKLNLTITNNSYTDSTTAVGILPTIGDIRIKFYYSNPTIVSIMATQSGNSFKPYISSTGYKIDYLSEKKETGSEILNNLIKENKTVAWILRLIGMSLIILGFALIISPFQDLLAKVPLLGKIFSWVTGYLTLLLGLMLGLIVIAIAWLRYQPLISLILIITVITINIILKLMHKFKNKEELSKTTNKEPKVELSSEKDETTTQENPAVGDEETSFLPPQESTLINNISKEIAHDSNEEHNVQLINLNSSEKQNITLPTFEQELNKNDTKVKDDTQNKNRKQQVNLSQFYRNTSNNNENKQ